jgi:hypothetical protein
VSNKTGPLLSSCIISRITDGVKMFPGLRQTTLLFFVCLLAILPIAGCHSPTSSRGTSREMPVYCGITMVKPMQELTDIFEKLHGCSIKLIKGEFGDLFKAIRAYPKSNLYLPVEASCMDSCQLIISAYSGQFVYTYFMYYARP